MQFSIGISRSGIQGEEHVEGVITIVALGVATTSAFAVDVETVEKAIPLKDGSTVHVFKDGKMGMEDKMGKAVRMKQGEVMETKDGQKIMMHGD